MERKRWKRIVTANHAVAKGKTARQYGNQARRWSRGLRGLGLRGSIGGTITSTGGKPKLAQQLYGAQRHPSVPTPERWERGDQAGIATTCTCNSCLTT